MKQQTPSKQRLYSYLSSTSGATKSIGMLCMALAFSGCHDKTEQPAPTPNSVTSTTTQTTVVTNADSATATNSSTANPEVSRSSDTVTPTTTPASSPSTEPASNTAETYKDYLVVLKDNVTSPNQEAKRITTAFHAKHNFTFETVFKGFAASIPTSQDSSFQAAMSSDTAVDHLDSDTRLYTTQTMQSNATWGLDRIDQQRLPLSTTYGYNATGAGVRAYIIDSGILASHVDFGGRVAAGYTTVADGKGTTDCYGHGTHVAGIVGSNTWGVAKGVTLVPVRIFDCNGAGNSSNALAALDWILQNGQKPAVINMSLGGAVNTTLDTAVNKVINAGYTVVIAAGNSNANACNYSPARVTAAITVGATTNQDVRASYSNFGKCLDIFAPGSNIQSTWYTSNTASALLNGTSMASPHVAGVAALILQNNPTATPAQITNTMVSYATNNRISSVGSGSPNKLLYMQGY